MADIDKSENRTMPETAVQENTAEQAAVIEPEATALEQGAEPTSERNTQGERSSYRGRQRRDRRDGRPGGDRRGGRKRDRRDKDRSAKDDGLIEKVVKIDRVAKTVKGGRNFRFTAVVVVGDGKGKVGKGRGKAAEIPDAIRKGIEDAKKNIITVPLNGTTIPHPFTGRYGAGKVMMRPAPEGTGVIAGGAVRAICELCGIKDIVTKSLGTNNLNNVANAAMECLKSMNSPEDVAIKRGISVKDLFTEEV